MIRRNGGIVCCALALLGILRGPFLAGGFILILAGLFQLFESRKGWCAIRAMGFKTPI